MFGITVLAYLIAYKTQVICL